MAPAYDNYGRLSIFLLFLLCPHVFCVSEPKASDTFKPDDSQCEQIKQPECLGIFPSNLTQFPNDELDFETQEEAGLQFHSFTPLLQTRCSPYLLPFLCGSMYPLCFNGATVPMCPYLCAMTRHGCDQNMVRFGLDWKKSVQCLDLDFEEHEECLGVNGIEDVGLFIRLKVGQTLSKSKGRVEISKDNVTWGTVCDDFWDNDAATVVCRQMGFRWGIGYSLAHHGPGDSGQPIYLDEVVCDGDEKSLLECNSNTWGPTTVITRRTQVSHVIM